MGFATSSTYDLTQINLGLGYFSGTNAASVSILTYNGGNTAPVPGAIWEVSNLPVYGSTSSSLTTISGISGVTLSPGVIYLLEVAPVVKESSNTDIVWNMNNLNLQGLVFDGGYTNGTVGAFDLLGTPVAAPELNLTSTFAALTLLAGVLVAVRGRKAGEPQRSTA